MIQLAPEWETLFSSYQIDGDRGQTDVALPPDDYNRLATAIAEKIGRANDTGVFPAVVTSSRRRRLVRTVMAAKGVTAPVLSYEEIGVDARPSVVGLVAA